MPIRTVIFDLGRTLVPFSLDPLEPHLCGCRAEAMKLLNAFEVGAIPEAALRQGICGMTGLHPDRFLSWWNSIFEAGWLIPPELIRSLRRRYRLGLMSNTNQLHFEFLRAERPLFEEFDFRVLSHEVGAAKPDPRIYARAEAAARCAPDEILFWDDMPENVEAARRRGWRAELFAGTGRELRRLRELCWNPEP